MSSFGMHGICMLYVWCLSIYVYPFIHNSVLLLLKMKTERKVIAKTNGRQPSMSCKRRFCTFHGTMQYYDARSAHFVCMRLENYYCEVRRIERGRSNTIDTIFLCIRCRRCRVFFAHAINRYSFRVEELSLSSSRPTFSIHLYWNHMAFSTNNTHAHRTYA